MFQKARSGRTAAFAFLILLTLIIMPLIKVPVAAAGEDGRTRVVMLIGSESFLAPLVDANDQLQSYPVDLKLFGSNDLTSEEKTRQLKQSL